MTPIFPKATEDTATALDAALCALAAARAAGSPLVDLVDLIATLLEGTEEVPREIGNWDIRPDLPAARSRLCRRLR